MSALKWVSRRMQKQPNWIILVLLGWLPISTLLSGVVTVAGLYITGLARLATTDLGLVVTIVLCGVLASVLTFVGGIYTMSRFYFVKYPFVGLLWTIGVIVQLVSESSKATSTGNLANSAGKLSKEELKTKIVEALKSSSQSGVSP